MKILEKRLPVSGENPLEIGVHKCKRNPIHHNQWICQEPAAAQVLGSWNLAGEAVGGSCSEVKEP